MHDESLRIRIAVRKQGTTKSPLVDQHNDRRNRNRNAELPGVVWRHNDYGSSPMNVDSCGAFRWRSYPRPLASAASRAFKSNTSENFSRVRRLSSSAVEDGVKLSYSDFATLRGQ